MEGAKLSAFALLVASHTVAAPSGTVFANQDRLDVGGDVRNGSFDHRFSL